MIDTPMDRRNPHGSGTAGALVARLEAGWQMIDAEPNPIHRHRLEDHWLTLLDEYQTACDMDPAYIAQRLEVA